MPRRDPQGGGFAASGPWGKPPSFATVAQIIANIGPLIPRVRARPDAPHPRRPGPCDP